MSFPDVQGAAGVHVVVVVAGLAGQLVHKAVFRFYQATQIVGIAAPGVALLLFFLAEIAAQAVDGCLREGEIQKLRAAAGNDADGREITGNGVHAYFLLKRASHLWRAPPSSLPLHWVLLSLPVHSTFWGT